jgi:hypothetical protein
MAIGVVISALFLTCVGVTSVQAQEIVLAPGTTSDSTSIERPVVATKASTNELIPLRLPQSTAIQVVLDREVRIRRVGQTVHCRVAEPVYAFDKLVIPVGTQVVGKITQLDAVSGGKRMLDALNADFTPSRKVHLEFYDLELINGPNIPIRTTVVPGSGQVIHFVTTADSEKKHGAKAAASEKADQAKAQAKRQWDSAMNQVHEPGKIHKIGRYLVAQLPVHPQYIDAGTVYFAELEEPLDFGSEPLSPEIAASIRTPLPPGTSVHVRLTKELSSANSHQGDEIETVLSQPLYIEKRLVLPQGSKLTGSVVQVRPARRLSRNGQLRMAFRELALPDGTEQKVEASLEGIQTSKGQNAKLDSESGAEATSPKTRYLTTGISVALALASSHSDSDAPAGDVGGNTSNRAAGGAGGFKLVGIVMGVFVHSQSLGMAMGAYGAATSVYSHFIARGHELVFAKDIAMDIGIGTHGAAAAPTSREPADGALKN